MEKVIVHLILTGIVSIVPLRGPGNEITELQILLPDVSRVLNVCGEEIHEHSAHFLAESGRMTVTPDPHPGLDSYPKGCASRGEDCYGVWKVRDATASIVNSLAPAEVHEGEEDFFVQMEDACRGSDCAKVRPWGNDYALILTVPAATVQTTWWNPANSWFFKKSWWPDKHYDAMAQEVCLTYEMSVGDTFTMDVMERGTPHTLEISPTDGNVELRIANLMERDIVPESWLEPDKVDHHFHVQWLLAESVDDCGGRALPHWKKGATTAALQPEPMHRLTLLPKTDKPLGTDGVIGPTSLAGSNCPPVGWHSNP